LLTEITQSVIVPATVADLFAQADELFSALLQGHPDEGGLALAIQKTSPGPLGLGTTFRVTTRAMGLSLGADLRCTEYVPPQHVAVQSTNGLSLKATLVFQPHDADRTMLTARLWYEPPVGLAGAMFEALVPSSKIEQAVSRGLQRIQRHLEATGAVAP